MKLEKKLSLIKEIQRYDAILYTRKNPAERRRCYSKIAAKLGDGITTDECITAWKWIQTGYKRQSLKQDIAEACHFLDDVFRKRAENDWSQETIRRLVHEVSLLWVGKGRQISSEAWLHIAECVGKSEVDCREQWGNLYKCRARGIGCAQFDADEFVELMAFTGVDVPINDSPIEKSTLCFIEIVEKFAPELAAASSQEQKLAVWEKVSQAGLVHPEASWAGKLSWDLATKWSWLVAKAQVVDRRYNRRNERRAREVHALIASLQSGDVPDLGANGIDSTGNNDDDDDDDASANIKPFQFGTFSDAEDPEEEEDSTDQAHYSGEIPDIFDNSSDECDRKVFDSILGKRPRYDADVRFDEDEKESLLKDIDLLRQIKREKKERIERLRAEIEKLESQIPPGEAFDNWLHCMVIANGGDAVIVEGTRYSASIKSDYVRVQRKSQAEGGPPPLSVDLNEERGIAIVTFTN